MVSIRELNIESLPESVCFSKAWWGSKHTLSYSPNEDNDQFGPIEYLVISKLDENGMPRLRSIVLTHGEESSRLQGRPTYQITLARNDFVDAIAKLLKKDSWIDTGSIYDQWTAPTARTILTGHYLATYHKKLFDGWNRAGNSKNEFKAATEAYWEPLAKDAGGVTRLTVSIYEELTAWGDSASASLLSVLMGTGPRTIHTRLQEARKSGYLHKPGIGSRR